MSALRSYRTVRRRNREIQAKIRSTTQRCFPRWLLLSMPFLAMRCLMPRWVQARATTRVVVSFVGMEFPRPATWTPALSAKRWNGVKEWLEHPAVMNIGATQQDGERNTLSISDDVPFCAGATAVRRAWSCLFAPLFAAMDALSMQARLQSSRSA